MLIEPKKYNFLKVKDQNGRYIKNMLTFDTSKGAAFLWEKIEVWNPFLNTYIPKFQIREKRFTQLTFIHKHSGSVWLEWKSSSTHDIIKAWNTF